MKAKIHPKNNPVVFIDLTSGAEFPTFSTLSSKETKTINGIEYQVIKVESSSASHPFYTGTQKSATKGNQVAKYLEKVKKAQESNQPKAAAETSEEKPAKAAKKSAKKK